MRSVKEIIDLTADISIPPLAKLPLLNFTAVIK
jgi:hypothetical protein